MGKYTALGDFLRSQQTDRVPITFAEIERLTGAKLPRSALQYRAWWSNNPANSVMTKVWLDAGYRTEQVDMGARRLVFRRADDSDSTPGPAPAHPSGIKHHPLRGALKGLVRIMPGTDLTEPADPSWGDVWNDKG